ncbi:trimeric intracellular cation channel family protein [Corynebacterium caspium]|uniref:trimeric intracellular cation channel family protein n=1 Tax=Corynebacterium caspium TaxID=234828 RepID=UPI00035DB741|nr:trimeric intracellular cation channel family protein [Corynebacterium caspium]WKD59761.1 hypothetical protein CCASP_06910 [Corynebacterium caspium DSM 44850]
MLLLVLFLIGITTEAMTAALSAGRQKMDFFGVIVIAFLTSLGGGTVRDVMLNHHPLTWVAHPWFLLVVIGAAGITVSFSSLMHHFRVLFLVLDAVGLAVFSVLGTRIALEMGYGFIIACVASVCTGVAGGILRDLMSDRIPLVFSRELYGTISILITTIYVTLTWLKVPEDIVVITSLIVGLITRLLSIYYNKNLPVFHYRGVEQPIDPRVRLSYHFLKRGVAATVRKTRLDRVRYSNLNRTKKLKKPAKLQQWTARLIPQQEESLGLAPEVAVPGAQNSTQDGARDSAQELDTAPNCRPTAAQRAKTAQQAQRARARHRKAIAAAKRGKTWEKKRRNQAGLPILSGHD